jgi:uncharacterized protein (UPF0371 family)
MGVNRAGFAIMDDKVVKEAATQEVIRRFLRYSCEYAMGITDKDTVERSQLIMEELNVGPENRSVVSPARKAALDAEKRKKGNEGVFCGAALELPDGTIVTGKNSPLMHVSSSVIINTIKKLADIPDKIHLISPNVIQSIASLKKDILNTSKLSLDMEETLIALSVSAASNPSAQLAMEKLKELRNCEMHITHIPTPGDEAGLRKLGINLTSDPNFSSKSLFVT